MGEIRHYWHGHEEQAGVKRPWLFNRAFVNDEMHSATQFGLEGVCVNMCLDFISGICDEWLRISV